MATDLDMRLDGVVEALRSARNTLFNVTVASGYCMCGDPIESHFHGSGHSPVDSDQYAVAQTIEAIDAALNGIKS